MPACGISGLCTSLVACAGAVEGPAAGSVTLQHDLTLDRGLSYEAALLRLQLHERQARAPLANMTADDPQDT